MSRQVEAGKPLTPEEREYLLAHGEDVRVAAMDATYGVQSEEDGGGDVLPYEQWPVEDLRAEIDDRNKNRDVKISKAGSRADMAGRLHEDDAQVA